MTKEGAVTRRRSMWIVLWSAISVIALGGAYFAGSFIRSPWADAAANADETVSAQVAIETREFATRTAVATGTVVIGDEVSIPTPASAGARNVVTSVGAEPGEDLNSGEALAFISGRPLIGLNLTIPMYRNLTVGDEGPDVKSLQNALREIGLYSGAADGKFGAGTASAIRRLYQHNDAHVLEVAETVETTPNEDDPETASPAVNAPARTTNNVSLPMTEIVDIPSRNVAVLSIAAEGAVLETGAELAVLRAGAPTVTARVAVADGTQFPVGGPVSITVQGMSAPLTGTVASVSAFQAATDDGSLPGYDAVFTFDVQPEGLVPSMIASVSPAGATVSVSGLAVPVTAVRDDNEGRYVLVGGEKRRVNVTLGLEDSGYVQLLPPTTLVEGDLVLIGTSSG